MKNPILLILIFFFYFGASAQLDTFDISNYILPDFQIKSNVFDFSFGGDGNNSFNDGINGERKYENHRGGLNLSVVWKAMENSRKKQKDSYSRISISPLFRQTKEEGVESLIDESMYVPLNFSGDRIIRHFRKAKRFIQYAIPYNLNISYQDHHYKDEINEYDEAYFVASASLQPEILIGFGRVEDVTPAWHALRMLSDLERVDRLDGIVDRDDIISLANLMTELKNSRFYDYRLKAIEDMEAIESKLAAMKLLKKSDIRSYNSINDMWRYGISSTRKSGRSLAFGLTSELGFNGRLGKNYPSPDGGAGIGLKIENQYHKPLTQEFQLDVGIQLSSLYMISTYYQSDTDTWESGINYNVNANIGFGWFPNTRTHFRSSMNYNLSNMPFYFNLNQDGFYSIASWSSDLYYYLSTRVRLSATLNLNYNYSIYEFNSELLPDSDYVNKGFNYHFNLSYSYLIY